MLLRRWTKNREGCALAPLLFLVSALAVKAAPTIEFTHVPPFGSFADLAGRVINGAPATQRVAVFIYIPGAGWWSKPFCDPQLTVIQPDGTWTADITTGGVDQLATKITALLVSAGYDEPCVLGPPALPANVIAQALASVTVERVDPGVRAIQFSGYEWWVKNSTGPVGPGPNYFSDHTNNVWLDAEGRLHLRITNRSNAWQCAELVTRRTFGYGSYRFALDSPVDALDPNVILGLFTWSDDPAFAHREIDIECARWGDAGDVNNAQYVIQPWDFTGHLARFAVPADVTHATHAFTWESNRVSFISQRGAYVPNPAPTNLLNAWEFTNAAAVPPTGDENVRINLWLRNGIPPAGNTEVEFVIRSFQFVPLGPPPPAVLAAPRWENGEFSFELHGQFDRRYAVQCSTNFVHWETRATLLATNSVMPFTDYGTSNGTPRFYRAVTLP